MHEINVYTAHLFFVSCSNLFIIQYTLCILQYFEVFSRHIALLKRGTIWEQNHYLASKVLIVYSKNRLRRFFLWLFGKSLLFLPARSKFFLIILFVTGPRDNLPRTTNVYGLDGQGIEFSVLSRRTPKCNHPPLQSLSILCLRQSGRSLLLTIHLLLVPLSNGLDIWLRLACVPAYARYVVTIPLTVNHP
jgi:hypothetical protein